MSTRKSEPPASQGQRRVGSPARPVLQDTGSPPEKLQKILDDVVDLRRIAAIQFGRLAQQIELRLNLVPNDKRKCQPRVSKTFRADVEPVRRLTPDITSGPSRRAGWRTRASPTPPSFVSRQIKCLEVKGTGAVNVRLS